MPDSCSRVGAITSGCPSGLCLGAPHRIEMTARLIRDGYIPGYANAALRLLPEWTQWCIEQSSLTGDLAARSHGAALTEAAALVEEKENTPYAQRDEAPFRRQE